VGFSGALYVTGPMRFRPRSPQASIPKGLLRSFRVALALFLSAAWLPPVAQAQWASLKRFEAPVAHNAGLLFRNDQGVLWVGPAAPGVLRVRFRPGASLGRDHSYTLDPKRPAPPKAQIEIGKTAARVVLPELIAVVDYDPLRVTVLDSDGAVLSQDSPAEGVAFSGTKTRVFKTLSDEAHVYGLGEKGGPLDKRGVQLGGGTYVMWNSDTWAYNAGTDPIYVSVPFYMVTDKGKAHGVFLDNTHRSVFDVGHADRNLLMMGAEDGALDQYILAGPTPKNVVARYADLTGHTPLPPRWALGFHQSRWGYWPESRLRLVADSFRSKKIPADVLWLDIDYQDGYKPFTWDKKRFPRPRRMLADLKKQGYHVVTIVDPHPAIEKGYPVYDQGLKGNHFVRQANGDLFTGSVWPMRATPPRRSVYPDYSRPRTRDWWAGLYKPFVDMGVAGIWNDMNEPAVGDGIGGTMPLDVRHNNEGEPSTHREVHNVYGQLMTRATFEGLRRAAPDKRPFVLTRATFAGGQRYSAVWTGDNQSTWHSLQTGLPTLLGLGLSGFSFIGNDIGGFVDSPTPELFTRWAQAAVFFPFMRAHTTRRSLDQEPWSYGVVHEAENRRIIELRYQLLPTIYNEMQKAAESGVPAMRPLFLEFPEDATVATLEDQFMWGQDILVAPVLRAVELKREVYLPAGGWYEMLSGRFIPAAAPEGSKVGDKTAIAKHLGQTLSVPVTLSTFPVYVRAGGFVFCQPVVQHTGQMAGNPLVVVGYPGVGGSKRHFYEDDGESLAYQRGRYCKREFSFGDVTESGVEIRASACRGSYRPTKRDIIFRVPAAAWRTASVNGKQVALEPAPDGFIQVRARDTFGRFTVRFE